MLPAKIPQSAASVENSPGTARKAIKVIITAPDGYATTSTWVGDAFLEAIPPM
jgi:hypothetical protein